MRTNSDKLIALLAVGAAAIAFAGAPNKINLQGVLRSDNGALEDGSFTFQVQIFPDAVTSTPILDELYSNVAVASGVFSLDVGSSTPGLAAALAAAPEAHVQFTVNGTAMPKQPINSGPYALHAATAASVPATGITDWPAQCTGNNFMQGLDAGSSPICAPALTTAQLAGSGSAMTAARSDHSHGRSCVMEQTTGGTSTTVATCSSGYLISGGCAATGGNLTVNRPNCSLAPLLCAFVSYNSWRCQSSAGTVDAWVVCCANPIQ